MDDALLEELELSGVSLDDIDVGQIEEVPQEEVPQEEVPQEEVPQEEVKPKNKKSNKIKKVVIDPPPNYSDKTKEKSNKQKLPSYNNKTNKKPAIKKSAAKKTPSKKTPSKKPTKKVKIAVPDEEIMVEPQEDNEQPQEFAGEGEITQEDIPTRNIKESEIKDNYSIEKLLSFLTKKNIRPVKLYSIGGFYKAVECISEKSGEKFILYITSKYPIQCIAKYKAKKMVEMDNTKFISEDRTYESYPQIVINPEDKNFLESEISKKTISNYKPIDMSVNNRNISENLQKNRNQLERIKNCTLNTVYKLGIITNVYICFINRHNDVSTYVYESDYLSDVESEELVISVDIDTFIDKIATFDTDIFKLYSELFKILNNIHLKELNVLNNQFIRVKTIPDKIKEKYIENEKYLKLLDSAAEKMKAIDLAREKILDKKDIIVDKQKGIGAIEKAFKLNDSEAKLESITELKNNAIACYKDIKNKYSLNLLNFDTSIFEGTHAMDKIFSNFRALNLFDNNKEKIDFL